MVLFLGQKNHKKEPRKNMVFFLGLKTKFLECGLFKKKLNQELIPIIAYVYTGEEQFVFNDWWCIILLFDDVRLRGVMKV